ncbi:hypothetical protein P692DRAFT_201577324 [Suillus brevipes Sb2]|nr:hypothetical protein P692DRAFT_201577324 [Suillus brevipes Sb2]
MMSLRYLQEHISTDLRGRSALPVGYTLQGCVFPIPDFKFNLFKYGDRILYAITIIGTVPLCARCTLHNVPESAFCSVSESR